MDNKFVIEDNFSAKDYNKLISSVGWVRKNDIFVEKAIKRSTFLKCIRCNNHIVAMGRAIGDGMAYIIADVVVDSKYQRKGLGKLIMQELIKEITDELPSGEECSVSLISTLGKEIFYKKCGFMETPFDYNGSGMKLKIIKYG